VSAISSEAQQAELLRLVTCGSVDDGKSTLIGRLLYDTKQIFVDQMEHIEETSKRRGDAYVNLALLTDGLRAEREQGITIDVAYRYFATPRRKFIIADTPGHVQYTRNMVTGASTADLAMILLDARKGVLEQSRRHAVIASLLQVRHLVLCVNKMDLVDYDQQTFERISDEFTEWAAKLAIPDMTFIPISALHGDNVTQHSPNTPWFGGRCPTSGTTTAATRARSRVGSSGPATRCWSCRRVSPRRSRASTSTATSSRRPCRRSRSRCD
jgi:bifunctional enzyme CysN/CysC